MKRPLASPINSEEYDPSGPCQSIKRVALPSQPTGNSQASESTNFPTVYQQAGQRCPICDWPIVAKGEPGCWEGNCSYRPPEGTAEYYRIQKRRETLKLAGTAQTATPSPTIEHEKNVLRQPCCPKCYEGVTFEVRLNLLQPKPLAICCGVCGTFLGLWDSLPAKPEPRGAYDVAADIIDLFLEYRDKHLKPEVEAKHCAATEYEESEDLTA